MYTLALIDVQGLLQSYGYWALLVIIGLESFGIPLPGESTLVAAGIYAGASHNLSLPLVITAAAVGAILGDNAGYLLGHWGGYRLVVRYGHYLHLGQSKVKVARYMFMRHGGKVVFFGRFVSVLRAYAAFFAGTTRMPWSRFLFFNATGGIIWAAIYGAGAYLLGSAIDRFKGPLAIGFGIAAVLAVVAGILLLRHQQAALEASAERALPGPLAGYPGGPAL